MAFFFSAGAARCLRAVRSRAGLGLVVLLFSCVRCGSADDSNGDNGFGDGDDSTGNRANTDLNLGYSSGGGDGSPIHLDPLCGVGDCIPDDGASCANMGGAGGEGPDALGGAAGGVDYDPGDLGVQGLSCRVRREPDCEGGACGIERACSATGSSGLGEPCVSAADCKESLACVGEGVGGVCRPYCCMGTERSCAEGTFCDEKSLPEAPEIFVPVCIPVDDCSLAEPFPCPEGQDCACKDDRGCVVVRADGATACTVPGAGRAGDPCTAKETAECAHGFVCSPSSGCMKLCSTVAAEPDCPNGGKCQSPSEFPSDLGVCVGTGSGSSAAR